MTHSQPFGVEQLSSFPVGSRVTYTCLHGAIRVPGVLDTVQCLPDSRWSELRDPCGLSCTTPTTLHFAALSEADEMTNFYPVGFTVSYVCRPGYENTSESQPTSTCLESLMWSEVPELCQRKSCGPPAAPPAGRTLQPTDFLFGTRVIVLCNEGYQLHGRNFIQCWLKGDDVEWSELPTCELITCSSPPRISNGRHDGEGVEKFPYNSTVTYSCDSGFQLIGNVSIRCMRADNARGVWSGAVPQCKEKSPPVKLAVKPMGRSPPPQSSQRRDLKPPKKTFTMEMKMSLYKKSLQNTNSFSSSTSFSRKPGSCATSALKFVMPLYKTQSSFSPGTHKQSPCSPKYRSISAVLPRAGCSDNTWWSKAAAFCGTRSWAARRTRTWQKCCYQRFPIRCKGLFYL
uniref:Sushi domain-containing protein n=1 Tax=Chrysolophus pictus TaxID=9089 RepID=A0A8C3KXI9_CHRPC